MKYYQLTFTIHPYQEAASDVLSALLADAGCETFVPEEPLLHAYIQQSLYDEAAINEVVETFPFPDTTLTFTLTEPEDRDWNEEWEREGFEDITIGQRLVIHDAHTPRSGVTPFDYTIQIEARQAFGTGTHQTTRMLLAQLLDMPLTGLRVIDAGCGTGILGFLCLMRGANRVLSYDIDEWSVANTQHNASLNNLPASAQQLEVRLGDASVIADERGYDLLIANINRNILLHDMPRFASALKPSNARLLLSGFYTSDVPYLLDEAAKYGLRLEQERHDGDWTMLLLTR